jgi:serine/threonine-protein kinase
MQVSLSVTEGPHKGREFTFDGHDAFIVGRSKHAHFRLRTKDRYFSRIHFLVEVNPPQCRLTDMGSRNGTYVNGQRVTVTDLKDGDLIRGGHTVIQVSVETGSEKVQNSAPQISPPPVRETLLPQPQAAQDVVTHTPPDAGAAAVACAVCQVTVSQAVGEHAVAGSTSRQTLLCQVCREKIRNHPQPIAGYHIIQELGRGGMGVVYLALGIADGTLIALKTIQPAVAGTPVEVERFLREARILCELKHPNIVAFRECGECDGLLYFAMEYIRGTDAARFLEQHGPLPIPRAVAWVCQLLAALEDAHAKRFVHRDIKPANLLVTEGATGEQIKLADFGLARIYEASPLSGLTLTGGAGGTPMFMAPEQVTDFRGAKPAVDQYSAAGTLYNLLTAKLAFDMPANLHQFFLKLLQEDPVPIRLRRADIPEGLAQVIHRALARDPANRFADVRQMREALAPFRG